MQFANYLNTGRATFKLTGGNLALYFFFLLGIILSLRWLT